MAYTLVRGSFTHQYPYGFVNVWRIGYTQVAINIVAILIGALLFMALFAGADWLIRKAPGADGLCISRTRSRPRPLEWGHEL